LQDFTGELQGLFGQLEENRQPGGKKFDYLVFNIVDYICVNCDLPRSGARRRALA
jgi:hypothetical protein